MLICIDDFIICPFTSLYFIVRPQAKLHSFNIPYMVWKPRKYITTSNTILYDPKTDILHFYKITSLNLYSVLSLFLILLLYGEYFPIANNYFYKDSKFWQSDILVCLHGSSFCITHKNHYSYVMRGRDSMILTIPELISGAEMKMLSKEFTFVKIKA